MTNGKNAAIRVGIGGWTYPPWRGSFYPAGLPHDRELEYASRRLTLIEVNGTFYRSQNPATFQKWHDETPGDFVFSLKGPRFATHRSALAEAGPSIERFLASGVTRLAHKLGPIVWQLAPTKRFEPGDLEGFLRLLPQEAQGRALRHALDVRHPSFACIEYLALARRHRIATVFTDSDRYPAIADITGDFVYARMMRTDASLTDGLAPETFDQLARCAHTWREGLEPTGLPKIEAAAPLSSPRDVFMLFIGGAKEKAPAAAMALLRQLDGAQIGHSAEAATR